MGQVIWSTLRQAAHSMRALEHWTLILFMGLKWLLIKTQELPAASSIKRCAGSCLSVYGSPTTKSRISSRGPSNLAFGLSDLTLTERLVITEGWCRANVWSELWQCKCIKQMPSYHCFRTAVKVPAFLLDCRSYTAGLRGRWRANDITWKGTAFHCMTGIQF